MISLRRILLPRTVAVYASVPYTKLSLFILGGPAGTGVAVGCGVGVFVAVGCGVGVFVAVGCGVGVFVAVGCGVGVFVAVGSGVGVYVAVGLVVGVFVAVCSGVGVFVAVGSGVGVLVAVGSGVGVFVIVGSDVSVSSFFVSAASFPSDSSALSCAELKASFSVFLSWPVFPKSRKPPKNPTAAIIAIPAILFNKPFFSLFSGPGSGFGGFPGKAGL